MLKNFGKLFLDENTKYLILNIFPQLKHYQRLSRLEKLGKNLGTNLAPNCLFLKIFRSKIFWQNKILGVKIL